MGALRAPFGSHKLLTLRLSMSANRRPTGSAPESTPVGNAVEKAAALKLELDALRPTARAIVMELRRGDAVHGIWTFTAKDLNVPLDPEALVKLQYRFERTFPGIRSFAEQSAYTLSEKFPSVVKLSFLDDMRQLLSATPSLPLYVSDSLRRGLDTLDPDRKVLWLEFTEPIGFLPWLAWEQILRGVVGVPIVRAGRQPFDALAPTGALDVLLAVTGCQPVAGAPKSIVALCRQILNGLPSPNRCVIHLFADVIHREPLRTELGRSGLVVTEGDEPQQRRGVVVYPFPSKDYAPMSEPGDSSVSGDALLDHQWPRWIRECMRGRGIDVIHVVSEGGFPALLPSLEVPAVPWRVPERKGASFLRSSTRVRLRQVDAPQLTELISSFGAWAVVFSAPSANALRAHRALTHQISGLLPGVFAVHDLTADMNATACEPLYSFLSRRSTPDGSPNPLPDSSFLCVQCHPSRLLREIDEQSATKVFGSSFIAAAKQVSAAFQTQDATPAWAAALQRQIEQSVSGYLSAEPLNERDKAAQDGVAAALTKAMEVIAKHTKPTT